MPDWDDSGWCADLFGDLPRIDVGPGSTKAKRGIVSLSSELREELGSVEFAAEDLPWAFVGRRWRAADAVRYEDFEVLVVDLHGLSVRLADEVIDAVCRVCAGRTVRLVHGQGHHSGGQSVLRDHVREQMEYRGLRVVDLAAGHVDMVP